ncbi:uncharacterized, partial [Tachysurus ichikawai]
SCQVWHVKGFGKGREKKQGRKRVRKNFKRSQTGFPEEQKVKARARRRQVIRLLMRPFKECIQEARKDGAELKDQKDPALEGLHHQPPKLWSVMKGRGRDYPKALQIDKPTLCIGRQTLIWHGTRREKGEEAEQ